MSAAPMSIGSLVLVAAQSVAIYLFLVLMLVSTGRRTMAQLTLIEFVTVALLGSAVETGLYRGSSSLGAGLVSAATILLANRGFSFLQVHVPVVRRAFSARPVLLACRGRLIGPNLAHLGMTENDVLAGIRRRGYEKLDDVRYVVLEPNGEIGAVPETGSGPRP